MDVDALLDKLEKLVDGGNRLPLTSKILVDEEAVFAVIDEIRHALPEELQQARYYARERERILAEARSEAETVVRDARAYASKLTDEASVAKEAGERAGEIIQKAQDASRQMRSASREYAGEVLTQVEKILAETLTRLQQNRQELQTSASKAKPSS